MMTRGGVWKIDKKWLRNMWTFPNFRYWYGHSSDLIFGHGLLLEMDNQISESALNWTYTDGDSGHFIDTRIDGKTILLGQGALQRDKVDIPCYTLVIEPLQQCSWLNIETVIQAFKLDKQWNLSTVICDSGYFQKTQSRNKSLYMTLSDPDVVKALASRTHFQIAKKGEGNKTCTVLINQLNDSRDALIEIR